MNSCLALLPLLLLTGCIIPVISAPKSPTVGRVIEPAEARFITVGQTTSGEVAQQLGAGYRQCYQAPAIAYSWEIPATGIGIAGIWNNMAWAGHIDRSHWRALFVLFDEHGIVRRTEFTGLSANKSLDDQLDSWAEKWARK